MSEGKILKKLEEYDKKFEKIDKKLEEHGQKLVEHGGQLAFICGYLGEKVFTKLEFEQFHQEYLQGQDQVMTILKRLDEERLSTHDRIRQVEDTVEDHVLDIRGIKRRLKMA